MEDAPFMLKLQEKMEEDRVGLLEDVEGPLLTHRALYEQYSRSRLGLDLEYCS